MTSAAIALQIVLALLAAAETRDAGGADAPPAPPVESPPARPAAPAELNGFMELVAAEWPRFVGDNYRFHPAVAGVAPGFCVDIHLKGKIDDRRFYKQADAIAFLLAVDRVAARTGAHWRVLYGDWDTWEHVARRVKRGSFYAVGRADPPFLKHAFDEPVIPLLDYHGPGELKLHLHLDVSLDPPRRH